MVSAPRYKLQVRDSASVASIQAQGGRLVADYGSYQLYETTQLNPELLGQPGVESRDDYNVIALNASPLDTSKAEVQALRQTAGNFTGKHLRLVQFAGPVQPAWRQALAATGVRIVCYVPQNAYLIYGDAKAVGQVQTLAAGALQIQWEGEYLNSYKIHPAARTVDAQGNPRDIGTDLFAIQLVDDAEVNGATINVVNQLRLAPVHKENRVLGYHNLVVALAPESLDAVAAQPDVISIQPYFLPKKLDERQAQILAGNLTTGGQPSGSGYLAWLATKGFTQAQFTSSGFAVDLTDSGLDNGTNMPNHPGLYVLGDTNNPSRVVYNRIEGFANANSTLKGCDGHGTLNGHVIAGYNDLAGFPFADALNYHYGLGICPFVRLGSSVIFDPDMFTRPDYTGLQSRAYRDGARISSNSWGGGANGAYTIDSQEYDGLVRDAQPDNAPVSQPGNQEMVIVFANGNSGSSRGTVGTPATAKNVISVGAAENVQPFGEPDGCGVPDSGANNANDIISFSSRGPCKDGRHKPDLVSPGTHVSGGVAQADNPAPTGTADACFPLDASGICGLLINGLYFPTNQQLYTVCSGTSQATPGVAGGCALVRQYFINNFGGPPSAAMTKAYLMNSARYMTGVSANDTLWSDVQGMGEMNVGMAFDSTARILRDQIAADLFTASGQARTFTYQVGDTSKPFRVTLAWTDAPGFTSGNAYNNDLDLTVTVAGNTYKGNVFSGAFSTPGGTADGRNNVESVFLPAGISGNVTITITATSINSDGVPNNSSPTDQDFALVVYNAIPPPPSINSLQPSNLMVLMGQPAAFTVNASGLPPLTYQWRKNGTNLTGAITSAYSIPATTTNDSGLYSVMVQNAFGTAISPDATLTVVPTVPLPLALDNTNLIWTTDFSTFPWYGQTTVSHDGSAAARSYFIGNNKQSVLTTTTNGPGTLTFWWKVSSQANGDVLKFTDAGGVTQSAQISGEVNWNQQTWYLPNGPQSLQWTYTKNGSGTSGDDAAYLDQVSFTPGFTIPFITRQPVGQSTFAASPVTFTAAASGTPVLSYQWRLNGVDIPGATSTSLTLSSPNAADVGAYSVRVSNPYGSVLSADAYLGVVPLVVRGDNSLGQISVSLVATSAVAVAAGSWHSLILRSDSSVLAWGADYDGQIDVPAGLTDLATVAAGGYHSLALKLDGTVVGWGANYNGQATPPAGLSNVIALAAGTWHSLALRSDGTVVAWGDNSMGQASVPAGLGNVVAIAAGGNHSLALRADGTVVAWGENTDAMGNWVGQSLVPFGLTNVMAIGAGDYHSLAVQADGTLVAWGDNSQGQSQVPAGLTNVVAAVGGAGHTVALKADSTVAAWGNDWNGQCDFSAAVSNVVAMAAGNAHTILLEGNRSAPPQMLRASRVGIQFRVLVQTFYGKTYVLESAVSLSAPNWVTVTTVSGTGALKYLIDPNANAPRRFYRVRQF